MNVVTDICTTNSQWAFRKFHIYVTYVTFKENIHWNGDQIILFFEKYIILYKILRYYTFT